MVRRPLSKEDLDLFKGVCVSDEAQLVMLYVPLAGTRGGMFLCYFVGLTLAFGVTGAFGRVRMVVGASLTGRGFCGG